MRLEDVLGYEVEVDEELRAALAEIERRWPADVVEAGVRADSARILEQVAIVRHSGPRLLDIGGGYCPFGVLAAAVGHDVDIVDSYAHEFFERADLPQLVAEYGVRCHTVDVVRDPLPFQADAFDAVTSFDSLEHWHHSPRGLNWLGYRGSAFRRAVSAVVDRPLRLRPTLCADLYLVGRREG